MEWTQRQVGRVSTLVGDLGAQLQPDLTITTRPVEQDEIALVSQPQPTQPQEGDDAETVDIASVQAVENSVAPESTDTAPAAGLEEAIGQPVEEAAPTESSTETPTELPTETPTTEPTPTVTTPTTAPTVNPATATPLQTPTRTPPQSASVTATTAVSRTAALTLALPTPTPAAPTPTPSVYRIRAGDTLFELALANDISLDDLLVANGLTEDDVFTIQPGDEIIIPDPNAPVELATETSSPTESSFTYTVQSGDTLMAIGLRLGVNIQWILDANSMTLAQARALRPGQELIIPNSAPATATPTPLPTATATLPAATPTPTATTAVVRLDTPMLRSPENGVSVRCGAGERLTWNPVPFIQPNDLYVAHLGYVNGRSADGAEQIVWVIAQQRPSNVTLWQLDDSLCGLAPLEYGRQWRWYVDVVEKAADGTLTPVSPSSDVWAFTWQ
jgi:LysM repeat protein